VEGERHFFRFGPDDCLGFHHFVEQMRVPPDLFGAGRRGAPVNGAGTNLEAAAARMQKLAGEVNALQAVAVG
jgi:hypothetical protein